jgi:hypothetical protein
MFRAVAMSAFVLANLIALSSCSSGATPTTSKVSAASPHPTGSAESLSPSTSPASGASVSVRISSRYTEVFATPLPADPVQTAVISGFRKSQILWDQSSVALRVVGMTREYVTGKALMSLYRVLQSFTKNNLVPVGVDRLFDTKITSLTADSATVTSCDDGTGYNVADRTTGQTESPVPLSQQYAFAVFTMRPVDGRWAISSVRAITYPDQRVKACMQDNQASI